MATKKSTKAHHKVVRAKRPRPPGDSPINIGGGGGRRLRARNVPPFVEIDFDLNAYVRNGDVWRCPGLELAYVTLNGTRIPNVTSSSWFEIKYQRGLFIDTIRVNENRRMGVRFYTDHLPYDPNDMKFRGRANIISFMRGTNPINLPNGLIRIEFHTQFEQLAKRKKKR